MAVPQTPMPLPLPQQGNDTQVYLTSVLALVSIPQPHQMPPSLPQTSSPYGYQEPITERASAIRPIQPTPMSFSSKHTYVIPAYKPYQKRKTEPKIAEVLLSLAMLVVTVLVVVFVLYYLSM